MSFLEFLKIEYMKVKRSKIIPLIFIAPLLVVVSGVANLSRYFTPEYTNAWSAMFIQSALVYAYYLLLELAVFFAVFVIAGTVAARTMGVTETLPVFYLVKWCVGLFLTMLPCVGLMWAITVVFEKPLFSVGFNLLLVIPGVLVANTPLWIVYPYCYSGYLVSCSLHDFTAESGTAAFKLFPFLPAAVLVFVSALGLAVIKFGKKEMR